MLKIVKTRTDISIHPVVRIVRPRCPVAASPVADLLGLSPYSLNVSRKQADA